MANKTTAEATSHHLQLAEKTTDDPRLAWHEQNADEVREVIKLVDYLRKSSFRANIVRTEVVVGALEMISGRLKMALGDY